MVEDAGIVAASEAQVAVPSDPQQVLMHSVNFTPLPALPGRMHPWVDTV